MFNFKCVSCEYNWDADVPFGNSNMITKYPCPKCDVGAVKAEKIIAPEISSRSISATFIKDSHHLGDRGFNPPQDFKDILKRIKKENPGSTIEDRW